MSYMCLVLFCIFIVCVRVRVRLRVRLRVRVRVRVLVRVRVRVRVPVPVSVPVPVPVLSCLFWEPIFFVRLLALCHEFLLLEQVCYPWMNAVPRSLGMQQCVAHYGYSQMQPACPRASTNLRMCAASCTAGTQAELDALQTVSGLQCAKATLCSCCMHRGILR